MALQSPRGVRAARLSFLDVVRQCQTRPMRALAVLRQPAPRSTRYRCTERSLCLAIVTILRMLAFRVLLVLCTARSCVLLRVKQASGCPNCYLYTVARYVKAASAYSMPFLCVPAGITAALSMQHIAQQALLL